MPSTEQTLLTAIQNHVEHQPQGYYGNRPVPVQIVFDGNRGPDSRWQVTFVLSLDGPGAHRRWATTYGADLHTALHAARRMQQRSIGVEPDA